MPDRFAEHEAARLLPVKIAVVSSHYPPNFVSGGTLIPQRMAAGLAARGHTVEVFAGAVFSGKPSLSTWTNTGDDGVTVHWTEITDMVDWANDLNHTNPRVDAAFTTFLREFCPDIVHLHSLQGFGAALVTLASASGAAVVLTMHDMWWWCARQFLVDRSLRPCSQVVSCGVCDCAVDNAWLNHRNRDMAAHLAHADLVLAPSRTMSGLLLANGVDPARIQVDENSAAAGISAVGGSRGGGSDSDSVRFLYAGGPNPLKGSAVAMGAAALLAETAGWSLDVFGMELPSGAPHQVIARPAYRSDEVGDVLTAYDVLLMPSVATESYSLITREAIDCGLVVISADNPGPAEVVRDGENGLVVPRGDAAALADAMRTLIEDRTLLERLRPSPGGIVLRSLDEQLDGLEAHYRRLISARRTDDGVPAGTTGPNHPPAAIPTHPIRRVLLMAGIDGAPLRYRARLAQEALAELGVRMEVRPYRDADALSLARTADAVVLYRVPATDQVLDLIDMVRRRPEPVPVLFDVDDLIFDPEVEPEIQPVLAHLPQSAREEYWRGVRRYRTTLEACDAYIGSTALLCDQVAALTGMPTYRFANGVGIQLARASDAALRLPRAKGPIRIGYLSGTSTHNKDWAYIESAVVRVMRSRPDVQLWLGGLLEPTPALAEVSKRIKRLPLVPWHALPRVLRNVDVNVAPLAPGGRFNEAKSAIKWLEAALVGTPTVASPTEPFRESIRDGHTGLLADSPASWVEAITRLVDDQALRHRMGDSARNHALLSWPPALQGRRYLQILEHARDGVAAEGHRPPSASWTPESASEPYVSVSAEPYGPARLPGGRFRRRRGMGKPTFLRLANGYRRRGWHHLRTNGLLSTTRKVAQVGIAGVLRVGTHLRKR